MWISFYNIIFSLQKAGGISVVWSELLKRMAKLGPNYKCLEYTGHEKNIFRKTLDIPESNLIRKNYPLLSFQRYLNPRVPHVCTNTLFIFHSSYYRFCPCKNAINITTVHDFTYEYFFSGLRKILYCRQKYRAIRHSDHIICISETTKKDLLKFVKGTD